MINNTRLIPKRIQKKICLKIVFGKTDFDGHFRYENVIESG